MLPSPSATVPRDPLLDLPTLELGETDEPSGLPLGPANEPEKGGPGDGGMNGTNSNDTPKSSDQISSSEKPKVMQNLRQVTPQEQEQQTKSSRQKQLEDVKKTVKEAARKKARTAKAKKSNKGRKAKGKKTCKGKGSKRLAVLKAKQLAKKHPQGDHAQVEGEEEQQPSKQRRKSRQNKELQSINVKSRQTKRTHEQVEPKANVSRRAKAKSKATSGAKAPPKSKAKAQPTKKTVDPEVKALRSRKSSAYHVAYKAALKQGASEADARKEGKAVACQMYSVLIFQVGHILIDVRTYVYFPTLCKLFFRYRVERENKCTYVIS